MFGAAETHFRATLTYGKVSVAQQSSCTSPVRNVTEISNVELKVFFSGSPGQGGVKMVREPLLCPEEG